MQNGYTTDKGPKPEKGSFLSFDHLTFLVGNAKQAAAWYCTRFGFKHFLYKGLETGERNTVKHVIKKNDIIFVFESALNPNNAECGEMLSKHGDYCKDIAFSVVDLSSIVAKAKESGAGIVRDIWEEKDEHGSVRMATVKTVIIIIEYTNFK